MESPQGILRASLPHNVSADKGNLSDGAAHERRGDERNRGDRGNGQRHRQHVLERRACGSERDHVNKIRSVAGLGKRKYHQAVKRPVGGKLADNEKKADDRRGNSDRTVFDSRLKVDNGRVRLAHGAAAAGNAEIKTERHDGEARGERSGIAR